MPSYDYRCTRCGDIFEAAHAIAQAAPTCPACGGTAARTILRAPAVHGAVARGRDLAMRSLPECGKGCRCCP
jgi:putative FmdB family regulatory protein